MKGTANYISPVDRGETNANYEWLYREPMPAKS
jgi:uncharacterized protein (DUF427 family)